MVAEAAAPKSKQSATKAAKAKREEMIRQARAEMEADKSKEAAVHTTEPLATQ